MRSIPRRAFPRTAKYVRPLFSPTWLNPCKIILGWKPAFTGRKPSRSHGNIHPVPGCRRQDTPCILSRTCHSRKSCHPLAFWLEARYRLSAASVLARLMVWHDNRDCSRTCIRRERNSKCRIVCIGASVCRERNSQCHIVCIGVSVCRERKN